LWDAFFDYYSNGEFAKIYERIYRQIIGLSWIGVIKVYVKHKSWK
jgi:hypothetical protein